jgi:hypothetical protein
VIKKAEQVRVVDGNRVNPPGYYSEILVSYSSFYLKISAQRFLLVVKGLFIFNALQPFYQIWQNSTEGL